MAINWFYAPQEGYIPDRETQLDNLNVTQNGTYNPDPGKGFAQVNVNVEGGGGGGGDFTTANVTIVSANQGKVGTMFYGLMAPYYAYRAEAFAFGNGDTVIPIILYQGQILLETSEAALTIANTSGAITYDSDASMYIITGDCTITIS